MNRPLRHALLALCCTVSVDARAELVLSSPALVDGGGLDEAHVLDGFGCAGENLSPALSWSGAPEGTRSYVVTVYDPDAPSGSGWWHRSVFDVPGDVESLPRGAGSGEIPLPDGAVQARNDFGTNAYGGACPPEGDAPHRYVFTVYAMAQDGLGLDAGASGAMVGFFVNTTSLVRASLEVRYGR